MLSSNVDKVLSHIDANNLALDVGGWASPFNRTNWILDAEPYETRAYYGSHTLEDIRDPNMKLQHTRNRGFVRVHKGVIRRLRVLS